MAEKRELIDVILSRNGYMDKNKYTGITNIESVPASEDCQHFGSLMERLRVTFSTEADESVVQSFIMKSKTPSGNDIDVAELIRAFPVEHKIYHVALENMNLVLMKEDIDEIPWPKYFGCEDNNMLLEDLKVLGYRMVEKQGVMDIDHSKLAVEGLAKFHALSMIILERGLFDTNFLSPSVYAQEIQFMIDMHNSAFNGLALSMERSWGEQWVTPAKRVREASKHVGDKLKRLWNDTRGKYNVINHGDCWTNNMMFKYSEVTGKPTNIKLVDFQLCHYNSPCWDLVHFLYTALLPETRERHMTSLLTTYADCLNVTCRKFDYKGAIPRITYIQETIQKLSYYAFILSCSSLPILLLTSQELNPEDKTLEHEENTGLHYPLYKFDIVRETMKKELKWFLETCKQIF